ncbi:MAG: hypothetical protein Q8N63_00660 [Nanoarchaeota archaeon]|nr:hypothetical protein [Nanoarchaeota archaeon]
MEKQTFKQTARKYLGTAIIGAGLALGNLGSNSYANEPNLPSFTQSVEQTFEREKQGLLEQMTEKEKSKDQVIDKLSDSVRKCNESFNEGIKDGFYTQQEQERTITYFNELNKQDKENNFYKFPSREKRISDLLWENSHGMDIGTPNLQKYLTKEDDSIKVEKIGSPAESFLDCGGSILLVLGAYIFSSEYLIRNKTKNKQK